MSCRIGLDRLAFGSQLILFHRQLGNVTIFPQKPWSVFAVLLLSTQTLYFRGGEGRVEACVSSSAFHSTVSISRSESVKFGRRRAVSVLHFQWLGSVSFSPGVLVTVTGSLATAQDPAEGL